MPAPADTLLKRLNWDDLDLASLRKLIELARDEDLAGLGLRVKPAVTGDRSTAALPAPPRQGSADLVARQPLVACGLPLIPLILSAYGGNASVPGPPGLPAMPASWRCNVEKHERGLLGRR